MRSCSSPRYCKKDDTFIAEYFIVLSDKTSDMRSLHCNNAGYYYNDKNTLPKYHCKLWEGKVSVEFEPGDLLTIRHILFYTKDFGGRYSE